MKNYLQNKPHRLQAGISFAIYSHLFLIVTSLLLMMIVPLLRQPIPLHELAQLTTHTTTTAPLIITIHSADEYYLNTEVGSTSSMNQEAVQEALKKQFKIMTPQNTSICIKSAPEVSYGKVLEMIEWLQHQGAQHVGLLTSSAHPPQNTLSV